jgi:hypothetical protein
VFVSTEQRKRFVLTATGVVALTASSLQAGNIILDIEIRTAEELTLQDIREVYGYEASPDGDRYAESALARARQAGSSMLALSPSYGGSCFLLAESVGVATHREWLERYAKRVG